MPRWRTIMLLALLSVVVACAHKTAPGDSNAFQPISGKARLLSIDHALGIGTLDINGKAVNFWWKTKEVRPSLTVSPGAGAPPPGWNDAGIDPQFPLETSETDRPFEAQPGDLIYFRGFELRGEILLTVAAAIKQ